MQPLYLVGILDKDALTVQGGSRKHTHPRTTQSCTYGYPLLEIQLLLQTNESLGGYFHAWQPVDFRIQIHHLTLYIIIVFFFCFYGLTAQLGIIVERDAPMQRIVDIRMLPDTDVAPHIEGNEPLLDEGDEWL